MGLPNRERERRERTAKYSHLPALRVSAESASDERVRIINAGRETRWCYVGCLKVAAVAAAVAAAAAHTMKTTFALAKMVIIIVMTTMALWRVSAASKASSTGC